jgi:hypothetical protein
MNENPPRNPAAMPNGEDEDTGEPIRELIDLEQETSPSFLNNILRKIDRRNTASQFLSFSWQVPRTIFFELGSLLMHILNAISIRKGE